MSTHVNDFATAAAVVAAQYPYPLTTTTNGPAVSLPAGDGPCFAVQLVGDAPGDGTIDGALQQSDDGTTWTAIPGATFAQVPGSDTAEVINFTRSARYVRWVGTLAGVSPQFTVSVLIGQQKKTI